MRENNVGVHLNMQYPQANRPEKAGHPLFVYLF